ncbi:MAG: alpha/beta hydrolase [bacterium]|nr:alpha/beta hydrolase [bacterium]
MYKIWLTILLLVSLPTLSLSAKDKCLMYKLGEEKFTYVDKEKIQYFTKGEGEETIVLLHGLGGNAYDWRNIVDRLASQGFRVIFWNMRGVGGTDKPKNKEDYSLKKIADQFYGFMKSINIRRAVIVGSSYGGAIAMIFAKEHPQMAKKLVLIDSLCYEQEIPFYISVLNFPIIPKIGFFVLPKYYLARHGVRLMVYNKKVISRKDIKIYAQYIKLPGAIDALIWTTKHMVKIDAKELRKEVIKKIITPTLIIWGDKDEIIPRDFAYRLHADIERSSLIMIPECGHNPQVEKPKAVSKAILKFIRK